MTLLRTLILGMFAGGHLLGAEPSSYDPLKVPEGEIVSKTFEVKDATRDRTLPIRVYLPEGTKPAPVVIFSHGLGGSRDNNPYLGNHWAARAYVVVFVQHPGSDERVWKDAAGPERVAEIRKAASLENYRARTKDIPAVTLPATTLWLWYLAWTLIPGAILYWRYRRLSP